MICFTEILEVKCCVASSDDVKGCKNTANWNLTCCKENYLASVNIKDVNVTKVVGKLE